MNKFMRLLVFFDLPVTTPEERKCATSFRQWLVKNGYYMVQYSVYARLCSGVDSADQHERSLMLNAPSTGSVRVLTVTEKQYASIRIISGIKKPQEKHAKFVQMSFFTD